MSELSEALKAQRNVVLVQSDDPEQVQELLDLVYEAAAKLDELEKAANDVMEHNHFKALKGKSTRQTQSMWASAHVFHDILVTRGSIDFVDASLDVNGKLVLAKHA